MVGDDERSCPKSSAYFGYSARKCGKKPFSGFEVEKGRGSFRIDPESAFFAKNDFRIDSRSYVEYGLILTFGIPGNKFEFGQFVGKVIESAELAVIFASVYGSALFGKNRTLRADFGDSFFPVGLVRYGSHVTLKFYDAVNFVISAQRQGLGVRYVPFSLHYELVVERRDFGNRTISLAFHGENVGVTFHEGSHGCLRSTYGDVDF